MHIASVTLQNFRCFGPIPTTVKLGPDVTVLIGANGTGKSAFIEALRRLFGLTGEERTLTRADVHFGPEESADTVAERQIAIDIILEFPELAKDDPDALRTVPEVFRVMTAAGPGEPLKARLRLEALWKRGESFVDEIDAAIYWISHLEEVEFGEGGSSRLDKQRIHASDRGRIQLIHVPAMRDAGAVTRQALRQLLRRLERSGDFKAETESAIRQVSDTLQEKMETHPAIEWVTKRLTENWGRLHTAAHLSNPRLVVLSQDFTQLLRSLTAKLFPTPDGRERGLDELSEGQTSLFFLALAATLAQLESELAKGPPPDGFTALDVAASALTIYTVEEPENHLSPFYLSRLMGLLGEICAGAQAMGLVTSHAPSVVRRVDPSVVRHFRIDAQKLVTYVNEIRLPQEDQDAAKFVRQAVLAQPEIYFASLVILGEGDSEAVVLPRVAAALGVDLDPSFVAFAPLGGRHVNHFWRLLNDLKIPILTILDFDLGRYGGGPLRLKYAYDQIGKTVQQGPPEWIEGDPETSDYWKSQTEVGIRRWREWFAGRGVVYSYPLDLDLMMLRAFPEHYGVNAAGVGETAKLEASVFGNGPGFHAYQKIASDEDHPKAEELAAYEALFKKRGKPGSHLKALSELTDDAIREHCPPPLRDLIRAADAILHARSQPPEAEA